MLWGSKEVFMAWIRLIEDASPEGEEGAEELEVLSMHDVGDRIAIHKHEGVLVEFEV